jgi:hypothetical protein
MLYSSNHNQPLKYYFSRVETCSRRGGVKHVPTCQVKGFGEANFTVLVVVQGSCIA